MELDLYQVLLLNKSKKIGQIIQEVAFKIDSLCKSANYIFKTKGDLTYLIGVEEN